MKKIILTGGGTAGHTTPNVALLPMLKQNNYEIFYIGSKNGIEKEIIENVGIKYYGISSGKLRRYLDVKNLTDSLRVLKGVAEAKKLIKKIKPDIIFSKGGFVSVPVVLAGKMCRIPVVIHESDITPGLANKISIPFATVVCTTFPETIKNLPKRKGIVTGTPIRQELFKGNKDKIYPKLKLKNKKTILLVMGVSLGSVKINNYIRNSLNKLLRDFNIIHICGKNNLDKGLQNLDGYNQFEYVSTELKDIFVVSDLIVSRAGANSIYEFLALRKPNLLIPLSKDASRGDQILNANSFKAQGFSKVIEEENLSENLLVEEIKDLYKNRDKYIKNMENSNLSNGTSEVMDIILKYTK